MHIGVYDVLIYTEPGYHSVNNSAFYIIKKIGADLEINGIGVVPEGKHIVANTGIPNNLAYARYAEYKSC